MTAIFVLRPLEESELCQPLRKEDFEILHSLNGKPTQSWRPVPVRLIHESEGQRLVDSDAPWFGSHALIFRRAVVEKFGLMMREHGELLPLKCSEAELFLLNAPIVDAMNEQASTVERFSGGGIIRVVRYVLRPEVVGNFQIFKIPNLRVSPTFVGERFVELWKAAGFRGLEFQEVWSSAH